MTQLGNFNDYVNSHPVIAGVISISIGILSIIYTLKNPEKKGSVIATPLFVFICASSILRNACLFFVIIFFLASCTVQAQDEGKILGNWKISNVVFVSPPNRKELDEILKNCLNKEVTITDSKFIFSSRQCFLFKSVNDFRITKHYFLSFKEASSNDNYYSKTIDYLFDNGKRTLLEAYKTNYTFDSSEGEVPELEIFAIDDHHIIINQDNNIVFLERE